MNTPRQSGLSIPRRRAELAGEMIGSKDPTLVHAGPIEELGVPEALSAGEPLPAARGRARYSSMVDDAEEAEFLDRLATSTAQMPVAQFRVVGGATARVPADATGFAHRTRRILVN